MLLDMLRSQLREGLGGRGRLRRYSESSMSSYGRNGYKSYGEYKNARNPKPGLGIPDLFDTGDFLPGVLCQCHRERKNTVHRSVE